MDKLKVSFERVVSHGTVNGGEDLFLMVRVTSPIAPQHSYFTTGLPAAIDEALALVGLDEEGDLFVRDGKLCSSPTTGYEFSFEKDRAELDRLVASVAFDGRWEQKGDRYEAVRRFYVDGNAD